MLTKFLTGGLVAGAIAVPLAGVAWADPPVNPGGPIVPGSTSQAGSTSPGPAANGQGQGQGQTAPGQPAAPVASSAESVG